MNPEAFFSESDALFDGVEYVWDALARIEAYVTGFTFGKIDSPIPDGVTLLNRQEVIIGPECLIEPGVLIEGPCWIGPRCVIRHGAAVRKMTVLREGVTIGHATEVKRSILLAGAKAPHFNYIGDAILGRNVNMGAGSKFANLRLDGNQVAVDYKGVRYQTGLKKFGGVLGDGCQIGCNCVLNPGTLIMPGCTTMPCSSIRGVIFA
ncbi:MAG: UDP-N-acetylglucosamine diphosphorylase [Chlamydiia bacterium]|nr:UDP-N-acetylglucosamine diphosphorylase [Chlamydiia bacterium]MCP5509437.1 UDP-N-acetylglucosamine diphosphorylase [Chlamydiales bacterium]